MGAWTICPLYWAPLGVCGASEVGNDSAPFFCQMQFRVLNKVLRVAALRSTEQHGGGPSIFVGPP